MEKTKMTKKETINLLIDVLQGTKEVEDMGIFVDYLLHERDLLERKSSSKTPTKTQKENELVLEKILEVLDNTPKTITDIQKSNEELGSLSNQKVSALLKKLVDQNLATRLVEKKVTYFTKVM